MNDVRKLIYMVAVGAAYRDLATMLVSTLRGVGEYTGKILLFTDEFEDIDGVDQTIIIPADERAVGHPNLLRWLAPKYIDEAAYDQIMYLDVDILCQKPMDRVWCAQGCLRYAVETNFIIEWPTVNKILMTDEEAEGKPVLNSGQFVIDAKHFRAFCELVWGVVTGALATNPKYKHDQSAFNKVIYSGMVDAVCPHRSLPPGCFNFSCGTKRYTDAIFWHYNRRGDVMRDRFHGKGDLVPPHGEGMGFNAGVLKRPYGWLVADRVRLFKGRNDVILRRFDHAWNEIYRNAPNGMIGMQDVRLMDMPDGRVFAYGSLAVDPGGAGRVCTAGLRIEDTSECLDGPRIILHHDFPAMDKEKNWQLFMHGGKWYASYGLVPHLVLSVDTMTGKCIRKYVSVSEGWEWDWGEVRGGTPWLDLGNGYMLSAFHSLLRKEKGEAKDPRRKAANKCLHYFAGWVLAETKPPFNIVGRSHSPIDFPLVLTDTSEHLVAFPMSLWKDGDTVAMAYGENDLRTRIAKFDLQEILAMLVPMKTAAAPRGAWRG